MRQNSHYLPLKVAFSFPPVPRNDFLPIPFVEVGAWLLSIATFKLVSENDKYLKFSKEKCPMDKLKHRTSRYSLLKINLECNMRL